MVEARGVPREMAEQHGAPERAAAGKSHGGLGGSYKVRRGLRALGPGLLLDLRVSFTPERSQQGQEDTSPLCHELAS